LVLAPPLDEDEVFQTFVRLAHEDEKMLSCTPFQVFDFNDTSPYDLESDGFFEEPFGVLDPSFHEMGDDAIENIDDFIYIGRHKWDMSFSSFDGNPIFYVEGHFQRKNIELLTLEQPYAYANDTEVCKHEDDMITDLFQPPRDDLLQHSHDGFRSHLGRFDIIFF
jgi:hypothetical protein